MNDILKKLKIKLPHKLLTIQAPDNFGATVSSGAQDCHFTSNPLEQFDSIHWFVKTRADLDAGIREMLKLATPGLPIYVYYPKGSSGIQTDLNRDNGWVALMQYDDFRWLSLISFDNTWSIFCFRIKTEKDRLEETKPTAERAIFKYADSKTKTITLPEDLKDILEKHPAEKGIFDALSFSNRREYVEWIITAKQAQTRQNRLLDTIERLKKGWKNPANR